MWRITRAVLRHRRRGGIRVDKPVGKVLAGLTAPNVRRRWGDLKDLRSSEREEIVHGDWREAKPIQLVSDSTDRDRGGFATPVAFSSEEAAASFLQEETRDDFEEAHIPSLQLAHGFFEDLSITADEEIDPESGALEAAPMADEQRADEAMDVHRHFFADYYIDQGIIDSASKYAFVDAMLTPGAALFEVNSEMPLARLTLRHQLQVHATMQQDGDRQPVLTCTGDFLVFCLDAVPTQPLDAPPRLSYSASRSVLAIRETQEAEDSAKSLQQLEGSDEGAADALFDMLMSEGAGDSAALDASALATTTLSAKASMEVVTSSPPSVGHVHWLQRNIASGTLLLTDHFTRIVVLAAVNLALQVPHSSTDRSPRVVADICGPGTSPHSCFRDVAHCAFNKGQMAETRAAAAVAESLVVVVALHADKKHKSAVPLAEHSPNLIMVDRLPASPGNPLLAACDVVLCLPPTTEDGVRPRPLLGASEEESAGEGAEALAPANRFIDLCTQAATRGFESACRHLKCAIAHARDGGYVVYGTRSMNPVENEAVVCAVLSDFRRREGIEEVSLQVECVPMDSVAQEYAECTREGLGSWMAVDGAPSAQDVDNCDPAIVVAVSKAAWRLDPLRHHCDGGFVVVLRVHRGSGILEGDSVKYEEDGANEKGGSPIRWVDQSNGAVAALTPAAAQVRTLLSTCVAISSNTNRVDCIQQDKRQHRSYSGVRLLHCGVPIGVRGGALSAQGDAASQPNHDHQQLQQLQQQPPMYLSSALSGSWMAAQLPAVHVPVEVPLLCEILRLQSVESRHLHRHLKRVRLQLGEGSAATTEEIVLRSFLGQLEAAAITALKVDRGKGAENVRGEQMTRVNVLLYPCLSTTHTGLNGSAAVEKLHEGVAAELDSVYIVALLEASVTREGKASSFRLSVEVPHDMPDYEMHTEALAEVSVAMRDALTFLLRHAGQVHAEMFAFRLYSPGDDRLLSTAAEDAVSPAASVDALEYDEYEVETLGSSSSADAKSYLSQSERSERGRRLHGMRRDLQQSGVSADVDGGNGPVNDWVRDMRYGKPRRW